MDKPFSVVVSRDRLHAVIEKTAEMELESQFSLEDFLSLLKDARVIFGVKLEILEQLYKYPEDCIYPVMVAEGIAPQNGKDAFLVSELKSENTYLKKEVFNFREVMKIPSVRKGQLLASMVPPTTGTMGTDIFGNPIPAKDGRPLKQKAGKNVVFEEGKFVAEIDGQISLTDKNISVNPVFEVNGDIDLRTGNIDFIGNVVIRGNVPTGYEIRAGGDVKVLGLVEGAHVEAGGNIVISGGVAGANRGKIIAGGNVLASYFNQADVESEQSVYGNKSILHSRIHAGDSLYCKRGSVIGGSIAAGKDIFIGELGNYLYTKTSLKAGYDERLLKEEMQAESEMAKVSETMSKLIEIEQKLSLKKGLLNEHEKQLILKQRTTRNLLEKEKNKLENKLLELKMERLARLSAKVYIYGKVYPNTSLHFGKYAKRLNNEYHSVCFYLFNSEIQHEPLT